jgi:multiple sugar transport system substrate-binding protein
MLNKKKPVYIAALATLVLASTACSGGDSGKAINSEGGNDQAKKIDMTKPLELVYYSDNYVATPGNDAEFMIEFGQYIQKKYPNVTFNNNIYSAQQKKTIDDNIAAGMRFDLHKGSIAISHKYVDLSIVSDISDLIKKHNVDLSGVNPILLEQFKGAAGGKLIGIPYQTLSLILFYNKGIFDKFGVPYPKEGMTWQDMAELTRKVTRLDGGVQYSGFTSQQVWSVPLRNNQLSLEHIDLKTNKVTFSDPRWKQLFDDFKNIFQIPGNTPNATNAFLKEQSLATILAYPNFYASIPDTMDWDMVSAPSMKDKPGLGFQPTPSVLMIHANSPFREEAFLVAVEMLSKSVQLDRAKNVAASSVLTDPEIRQSIGSGIPALKGKNTAAMQPANMAPAATFTPYTADVTKELMDAFNSVMNGTKDTNTALREAEEKSNQIIAEKMAAEGKK